MVCIEDISQFGNHGFNRHRAVSSAQMVVQGFFLRLVKQQIQRGGQLVQVAVVHGSQSIYQLHIAAAGIRNAVWRGRMEEIQDGVYLDGAHNEGGIRAFAGAAAEVAARRREESGKDGRIFLLFAAVFGGLRVLSVSLNVVSRLPIISGLNRLAGAVLGGAEGIFFVWIAALLITLFSATAIGELFLNQIENNIWLTWLYDHNMLGSILMGVVKRII